MSDRGYIEIEDEEQNLADARRFYITIGAVLVVVSAAVPLFYGPRSHFCFGAGLFAAILLAAMYFIGGPGLRLYLLAEQRNAPMRSNDEYTRELEDIEDRINNWPFHLLMFIALGIWLLGMHFITRHA